MVIDPERSEQIREAQTITALHDITELPGAASSSDVKPHPQSMAGAVTRDVPGIPTIAIPRGDTPAAVAESVPKTVPHVPTGSGGALWFCGVVSRRGWLLFAVLCVLWGIPYVMIKVVVAEVSAPVLVLTRTAVGAVVLLPLAIRSGTLVMLRRHWPWVLAFTTLQVIGPWWLLSDAELRLSSSVSALFIAAAPTISVVLAPLFGDTERPTTLRLAGLLVGLAGVVLLAVPQLGGDTAVSVGEMLLVALGYATAPLIAAHRLVEMPGIVLTAGCLTVTALFYVGPAAATWPVAMPSARVLWALAGLALLCTALAFVVLFALIREVGATRAMVYAYVSPAVAVVVGVVLLGEPFTMVMVGAFAMILAGSVLATRRSRIPPAPAAGTLTATGRCWRATIPRLWDRGRGHADQPLPGMYQGRFRQRPSRGDTPAAAGNLSRRPSRAIPAEDGNTASRDTRNTAANRRPHCPHSACRCRLRCCDP
jgi:drug/metabolite transporter (DMT)-like permease